MRIGGNECSISRVSAEPSENKWVHLNRRNPLKSAFALHDGRLTIQRLIRCELDNPRFAYLSSDTTVGGEENSDEVIHLGDHAVRWNVQ
ncbi:hypothetical protein V8E55_004031 [Tylopilus felleus]